MFSVRRIVIFAALIALALPLSAATATSIIPSTAPHGARAVIVGSGLDAPDVAVTFSDGSFKTVPATIVSRSPNVLELIVPSGAATGIVHVTNGSGAIASLDFTLAADANYTDVATLTASDKAHDVLKQPSAVAVAIPSGMIFVADRQHHQIAILQPNGKVSLIVGTGHPGLTDGAATQAEFKEPQGIVVDNARQLLYVADTGNNAIRRITFDGSVSIFAGGKHDGATDGTDMQASFKQPTGLAIDAAGNVYVADTGNSSIRMITPGGVVTTIAGGVHDGLANGAAKDALFHHPEGVAVSFDGAIYVSDTENNAIRVIAKGVVATVAGTGHDGFVDGAANLAEFKHPSGIAFDDGGNLFVADAGNNAIRKIATPSGAVSTNAGTAKPGNTDGPVATAQFNQPAGIAYSGILLIADAENDALRIITAAPHLTAIYPTRGPLSGGNTVRIFGTSFLPGATAVAFGGVTAADVTFVTSTELLVKVPPASAGTVDVTVTTPFGTDTLANGYSYVPPPTISSIAPAKGMTAGGQTVEIIGTNYTDGDTVVTIGGASAAVVQFVSPATITVTTPPGNAGPADVVVTTPGGTATLAGAFTYFAPPVITSISPAKGFAGTIVTITGQNFDLDVTGDQLLLGTAAVTITSASSTQIIFTVPNGASTGKLVLTTAGGSVQSATDFVVPVLTSIAVTPASATVIEGQTQAFTASGTYSDDSTKELAASWSSSDMALATVDANGLANAVHYGTATITAAVGSIHGSATLTIQPRLVALSIAPQNATVKQGASQAFTATASYSDGSTKDATKLAQWSVSDATLATVDASGNVTTTKYGTVTVTAKLSPFTASTQLTIAPIATALSVAPATLAINQGSTGALVATVAFSDNSTKNETSTATWTSGNAAIATVSAGTVTGVAPGQTTVTAAAEGFTTSSAVTVSAVLQSIHLSTSTASILKGQTLQLTANGTYSDGTTANLTSSASWTTSNSSVATVSAGLVTAVGPGTASITAASGNVTSSSTITVTATTLTSIAINPSFVVLNVGGSNQFAATATYSDGSTRDATSLVTWASSDSSVATVSATALAHAVAAGTTTITATYGAIGGSATLRVLTNTALPPDPTLTAPPLSQTSATSFGTATSFLYSGFDPIQIGATGIDTRRVAVLRGRVVAPAGAPITGVSITALGHPELGSTLSRADGAFDFAVNGGGTVTIVYAKVGSPTVQRSLNVPWLDYVSVPDAVLIPYDTNVTTIVTNAATVQMARGSAVTDGDGTRQATLVVPPHVLATLTLPNGTSQPLSTLSVRATEYTVGSSGPAAMPATLPNASGYTYCVELSADEAVAANATTVTFSQPLYFYVENFLHFHTGGGVPTGYYDRVKGTWVASADGQVISILAIQNGEAQVDVDGSGTAASSTTLTAMGFTDGELQQLASLYTVGTSLWRVPITHFTPWDHNWPFGPPPDATWPNQPDPTSSNGTSHQDDCDNCPGSVIGAENQSLGEELPVTGTDFSLHYQSDRMVGYAMQTVQIPLTGASVPASLVQVQLIVSVAGRTWNYSTGAATNQSYVFQWDGRDAYGRPVQGIQPVKVQIGYVYHGSYQTAGLGSYHFGLLSPDGQIDGDRTRQDITLWQTRFLDLAFGIGNIDPTPLGLGGWTLSANHVLDPYAGVLYLGDGSRRSSAFLPTIVQTIAGSETTIGYFPTDVGIQATNALLGDPRGVASGPDGTTYIADIYNHVITVVSPSGITSVLGVERNCGCGYSSFSTSGGDGGPVSNATFSGPIGVALGPDGSLYAADWLQIRRITPDGRISTIAGTGDTSQPFQDGVTATSVSIQPTSLAVGPDGAVYFGDVGLGCRAVRRVDPSGRISTVAGGCNATMYVTNGHPAPAGNAMLSDPEGVAVDRFGSVYIADAGYWRIYRVTPSGFMVNFAGTNTGSIGGDGGYATATAIQPTGAIAVGPDDAVYFTEHANNITLRRISTDGLINTVAGRYVGPYGQVPIGGDGGPSTQAGLGSSVTGIAFDAQHGILFSSDWTYATVRRLAPLVPGHDTLLVPSEDGSEVFEFSRTGVHLRTLDPLTGVSLLTFTYDGDGRLTSVTDVDGNVTSIQHDGNGNPTAIVAPGGQQTTLTTGGDGLLASFADPAGATTSFTYSKELLTAMTDARGGNHAFTYDSAGKLQTDQDPAGGLSTLNSQSTSSSNTVSLTTAMGRQESFRVEQLPTRSLQRTTTDAAGLRRVQTVSPSGGQTIATPDGTVSTISVAADPQFGMLSPLATAQMKTTSGLVFAGASSRTVSFADPTNPLTLTTSTSLLTLNGHTWTTTFSRGTNTLINQTPLGRTTTTILNTSGHPISISIGGLTPTTFSYGTGGLITSIGQGSRRATFAYNQARQLTSLTDSLDRTSTFVYDADGRIASETLPDGRTITLSRDGDGNVTSITAPARPPHAFTYTPIDLLASYAPPLTAVTQYSYNGDRQLTGVIRPDQTVVGFLYDAAGRLATATTQAGNYSYGYDDAAKGTVSSITAPDGSSIAFKYDGSLVTSETWSGAMGGSVAWAYDNYFRLASENGVGFSYDADGLLTTAGALTLQRDPQSGLVTSSTVANASDSRSYNSYGEPTSYSASFTSSSGVSPLLTASYVRDAAGRIVQKTEALLGSLSTIGYTYDAAGRIASATQGSSVVSFAYDDNGNRTSKTTPFGTETASYDAEDRLVSYNGITYAYTPNGELATKNDVTGTTLYRYDAFGRLQHVTLPDGRVIDYLIDATGRRIGKKINGSLVKGWLYSGPLRVIAETDGAGVVVSRFVYASRSNTPDYMIRGGATYLILSDHLGSPRLVIDTAAGTIAWTNGYDESGMPAPGVSDFIPFGFAGGLYDADTKLVHFGKREYDAQTGRWTAKDSLRFGGGDSNLYAYAMGDPVNNIDESGLAVFIGWHPAVASGDPEYHGTVMLQPDDPSAFAGDPLFSPSGGYYATLGGQPFGTSSGYSALPRPFGNLRSAPNYPLDNPSNVRYLVPVCRPGNMSDTEFIRRLIAAASRYNNNAPYMPLPTHVSPYYNSNSYIAGVVKAAGGTPPLAPVPAAGYDKPLPIP